MSVADLRDAYHTLSLSSDSQEFCGVTPFYVSLTYYYMRISLVLSVSPAIWQQFSDKGFKDIPIEKGIQLSCITLPLRVSHLC